MVLLFQNAGFIELMVLGLHPYHEAGPLACLGGPAGLDAIPVPSRLRTGYWVARGMNPQRAHRRMTDLRVVASPRRHQHRPLV